MSIAGPSGYRLVAARAESAQSSHSSNSARQQPSCRTPLRSPSPCESLTGIPKPESSYRRYSHTSLAFSSTTPSGPSRSCSPDSSPASSVKEVSITDEEVKEPEPDLPKAPEHFTSVFSVPKTLFDIYETYREWHFSFAPTQNVHSLVMKLNEATLQRDKAEQQVRDLTERLSSGTEGEERGSEVEKLPASKQAFLTEPDPRQLEIIQNKENKPLEDRFEDLVDWSYQVQEAWGAAQKRNTLLDDKLDQAGKNIRKLEAKERVLEGDKKRLEKQLKQSRSQRASGHDSPTLAEEIKNEDVARQSLMTHDDESSMIPVAEPLHPLSSQNDQENRLAELERENERLRQENDELRCALEQPQNETSPAEEPDSQSNETQEEQAPNTQHSAAGAEDDDVEMGNVPQGQDSTTPQYMATENEVPAMPVTPPVPSEAEGILRFYPPRLLNNIDRDSRRSSDDARRRRHSRRHERRRRREQKRLEREEEEARRRQHERLEREEEAQQHRKHRNRSDKGYKQKRKTLWPLGWVRYRRQTLMDFFSFSYMFSHRLSYRSG